MRREALEKLERQANEHESASWNSFSASGTGTDRKFKLIWHSDAIFAKDGMRNSDKWFRISVVFVGV